MGASDPLRVLIVVPVTIRGGAGEITLALLTSALADGVQATVVVLEDGPLLERLRATGAEVILHEAGRARSPLRFTRAVRFLRRIIEERRPDVVYATEAKGHVYAGLAARLARVPAVWRQPGRPSGWLPIDRVASLMPAHCVIVASQFVADEQRTLSRRRHVEIVTPGIVLDRFATGDGAEARRSAGIAADAPLVTIVGRLQRWKGQDVFLRAAARVAAAHPEARFAVVGDDEEGLERPDYAGELRRLARELGIEDRVVFTGHADPAMWYDASDVLVSASDHEPFGLAIIEAMAMGRPVVAIAQGGPAEVIDDGRTGVLVARRDPEELAAGICRLLEDADLRAGLGSAARSDAQQRFGHERMAREIIAVLSRAAGRSPTLAPVDVPA